MADVPRWELVAESLAAARAKLLEVVDAAGPGGLALLDQGEAALRHTIAGYGLDPRDERTVFALVVGAHLVWGANSECARHLDAHGVTVDPSQPAWARQVVVNLVANLAGLAPDGVAPR